MPRKSTGLSKSGRSELSKNRGGSFLSETDQSRIIEEMKYKMEGGGSNLKTPKEICEKLRIDYLDYMRTVSSDEYPEFTAAVQNLENAIISDIRFHLIAALKERLADSCENVKDVKTAVETFNLLVQNPVKSQHVHFHNAAKDLTGEQPVAIVEAVSLDAEEAEILDDDSDGVPEDF
jgi:hypothetical protein